MPYSCEAGCRVEGLRFEGYVSLGFKVLQGLGFRV